MVDYLRSQGLVYPQFDSFYEEIRFANELNYWKLPPSAEFERKNLEHNLPLDLLHLLRSEPTNLKANALSRWKELGPIDFKELIKNSS